MMFLRHRRWLPLVLVLMLTSRFAAQHAIAQVYVKGYTKSNGTYVAPHYRSNPDGIFSNNWSTKGNVNPYTGEIGTRVTPPSHSNKARYRASGYIDSYAGRTYLSSERSQESTSGWQDNPFYRGEPSILLTSSASDDDRLRDVATMEYHGIGLSTTHERFLKQFPHAKPAGPADSAGVISYAIEDVDGKRDVVWFQFLDNRILRLVYAYQGDRIREYGGTRVLEDRARERYGSPTRQDDATLIWQFPTIDRQIMATRDRDAWHLVITKLSLQQTVNAKRAVVDVGF
jgi:hypothetical protein